MHGFVCHLLQKMCGILELCAICHLDHLVDASGVFECYSYIAF